MTQKIWKIHQWLGLYTGLVIGILCFTGVLAVFIPEVESVLYLRKNQVEAITPSNYKTDYADIEAILTKYPGFKLFNIRFPTKPTDPFIAMIGKPGKQYHLYVNPHSGKLLSARSHLDGLTNFLRQFHVRLFDKWYGRQIVGLAGISLLIITITGTLIYGGFMRRQTYGNVRKDKGIRIFYGDWHKIVGVTALAFNFVIAFTGAWLGLQPKLMDWLNIEAPFDYERKPVIAKALENTIDFSFAAIYQKSKTEFPEMQPTVMSFSKDGSATIEISGNMAGSVYERNSYKQILDKRDLTSLYQKDIRESSFSDKIYYLQEALHFGDFAGLALKIVYGLFGLTGSFLSVTGFFIYLKRKNKGLVAAEKFSAGKKVIFWIVCTVFVCLLIMCTHLILGYKIASNIVTFAVYSFFCIVLLWLLVTKSKTFYEKKKKEYQL